MELMSDLQRSALRSGYSMTRDFGQDGAANASQPIRSETNPPSSAAGTGSELR